MYFTAFIYALYGVRRFSSTHLKTSNALVLLMFMYKNCKIYFIIEWKIFMHLLIKQAFTTVNKHVIQWYYKSWYGKESSTFDKLYTCLHKNSSEKHFLTINEASADSSYVFSRSHIFSRVLCHCYSVCQR